jgi:hypothetical protein
MDRNNTVIEHQGDDAASDWPEDTDIRAKQFTAGQFIAPQGACFDHAGNIFVVEWVETGRVTRLRKI